MNYIYTKQIYNIWVTVNSVWLYNNRYNKKVGYYKLDIIVYIYDH